MDVQTIVIGVIAVVVGAIKVLDFFGYLPKARSTVDANAELQVSDRTIKRLRNERNAAIAKANELALQRTNEPVLEVLAEISRQLGENAKQQAQVIDRLAKHNGSFTHMEQSLGHMEEGLKVLTGFITSMAEIPMREKS